jgi:hypothetical protein
MASQSSSDSKLVLPLHVEDVSIERRKIERNVRVRVQTVSHDHEIDETISRKTVESSVLQLVGQSTQPLLFVRRAT